MFGATGLDSSPLRSTRGVLREFIATAERKLTILNPYIDNVGAEFLAGVLSAAIKRGVTGEIIVRSGRGDLDPNTGALRHLARKVGAEKLEAAFALFQLKESDTEGVPFGLHAKAIIADDSRAFIGSANLTRNGLDRNLELGVGVGGATVVELSRILAQHDAFRGRNRLSWIALARPNL